jgi:hypothetical protein
MRVIICPVKETSIHNHSQLGEAADSNVQGLFAGEKYHN